MRATELATIILVVGCLTPIWAQEAPPPPQDGQTPSEYSTEAIAHYLAATDRERAKTDAPAKVAAKPTTTGASSGFGERVNDSISDFLPLFQFAVNAVSTSDDGKSVTIKANPIKGQWGALSLEATLVEPEISSALLDEIAEGARETQEKLLLDQTDDLDNIIWSASYGYVKDGTKAEWGKTRRLWGRDYKIYEKLVGRLLQALWKGEATVQKSNAAALLSLERFDDEIDAVFSRGPDQPEELKFSPERTTFKQIKDKIAEGKLRSSFLTEYVDALNADALAVAGRDKRVGEVKLDELASLIDNQPQIVANYSYRDRDRVVGPDEESFNLKIEWGRRNFNKVLKEYKKLSRSAADPGTVRGERILTAYSNTVKPLEDSKLLDEDKFSFSVSYKRTKDHMFTYDYEQTVTDPMTMMDTVIPRMAPVDQKESKDWTGSLQWTHTLLSQKLEIGEHVVHPKLEMVLEYTDVENEMLKNSRFTARVTYAYPLTETVSLPISLVYSDDPEFVRMSDPDKEFSAHAGLSYKIKRNGK